MTSLKPPTNYTHLEKSPKKSSTTASFIGQWLPPSNEHIERNVLSVLTREPEYYAIHALNLSPELFYKSLHEKLFRVLVECYSKFDKITLPTLVNTIKDLKSPDEKELLAELISIRNTVECERDILSDNIEELSNLLQCRKSSEPLARALASAVSGNSFETEGHVQQAAKVLSESVAPEPDMNWKEEFCEWLDTPLVKGLSGIDTGLKYLNHELGGWQNTDFIVLAARPGMGKTIALTNHAYHAALSGVPTAFISCEVDRNKVLARIIGANTTIPYGQIGKRDLSDVQKKKVKAEAERLQELPLYIYDYKNSIDIADVSRKMRHWQQKYGVGLVVCDYLQKMEDKTVRGGDDTALVNSLSDKLKKLQSSMNCPLIAGSQLNRRVEERPDKRPVLSDIRQSGKIEQDAAVVIALYRDDYYEAMKDPEYVPMNEIEYIGLKNREGGLFNKTFGCKAMYNQIFEF